MWPSTRPNPFRQADFPGVAQAATDALHEIVSVYNAGTKYSFPPRRNTNWPLQLPQKIIDFEDAEIVYNAIVELADEFEYFAELHDAPVYLAKSGLLKCAAAQFALARTELSCSYITQAATL